MPRPSAPHGGRWARREVLRLGLAVPLLAGCSGRPSTDPLASSSPAGVPSTSATPGGGTPAPGPGVPTAASAEQALSEFAAAVLDGPHRADLGKDRRTLLAFLRDAHADHAVALAGDDPTARPTTAAPSPTAPPPDLAGIDLRDTLRRLTRAESAQASDRRRAATAASGLAALLAGSLAVAAETYAAALGAEDVPAVDRLRPRRPAPVLTDVAAAQQLVAQLHAVVYGYQLAIGKLRYASASRKRALGELAATRRALDAQIAFLLGHKAEVPASEPAYVPSPDPRSPGDAGRLVRGMQTRLEPFAGLVLAAASTPEARTTALTSLRSTTRTAHSWGSRLQVWPGWPD